MFYYCTSCRGDWTFVGHRSVEKVPKMVFLALFYFLIPWFASFYDKLCDERSKLTLPELLHIGSCGLRVLHGSFKTGESATD